MRIAQFEKQHDASFSLDLAKRVVSAKMKNALTIVRRHHKNHPEICTDSELRDLDLRIQRVAAAKTLETLRGLEGATTTSYFKLLGKMLNPPWQFAKRTRRPPKDPVNAVLSLGYVIVGAELESLLDGVGFDPYLGYYHAIEYGRPSLALDLLEEFRHPLVDRLALNLFNLSILGESDFSRPPRAEVYLNTSGRKKFFQQYERMLGEFSSAADPTCAGSTGSATPTARKLA